MLSGPSVTTPRTAAPSRSAMPYPQDSLNIGLSQAVRVGHDRFPRSPTRDTRDAGQSGGAPFVAGQLNLDRDVWAGYVPAARVSTR